MLCVFPLGLKPKTSHGSHSSSLCKGKDAMEAALFSFSCFLGEPFPGIGFLGWNGFLLMTKKVKKFGNWDPYVSFRYLEGKKWNCF